MEQQNERAMIFEEIVASDMTLVYGRPSGGGAPGEICASKVSRGEGGMTERYEKSPVKRPGFLNGAKSMDRPPGRQGPRKNLRSKILWGEGGARERADGVFCKKQKAPEQSELCSDAVVGQAGFEPATNRL